MPCLRAFGRRAEIRRRSSSVRKLFFLSAAAVFQRNLIDTSLMAASFEFGVQENIDDFAGRVGADEPRRHGADVGVVVAACQRCTGNCHIRGIRGVRHKYINKSI